MTGSQVLKALGALKAADYVSAFKALRLHKRDLEMLQTHYDAPGRTMTATQMAHALGFGEFAAANLHYGILARRVGEQLGLEPETSLFVLATFDWPEGECEWIMRPQVAHALETLGWIARKKSTRADRRVTRFWTCHWQFRYWRPDINSEGQPCCSSGSNSFRKRGVSAGDSVYIISLSAGQLYLGGRMVVKRIISRPEAVRLWKTEGLYHAKEWAVDPEGTGTPLNLHRRLSPALTKQLRFKSKDGSREPFFVSDTELDNQATRGVRELTPESAAILDRIIEVTDRLPRSDQLITVTEELLRKGEMQDRDEESSKRHVGAGFGVPAENKEVEDAAIHTVRKHYEDAGWVVRSLERDKCGFDLECRKKQAVENVEVKGVRGTEQAFLITAGEVEQARTNRNFVLAVVTSALSSSPVIAKYSGPEFHKLFALSPVQYRAVLQR